MKRSLTAVAIPVAAALAVASPASAFTHEVGATGVGNLSPMAFGGLANCASMSFRGHITSNFRTFGDLGGTFRLDSASFEGCTGGARVSPNLPVSFSVDPAGGYSVGLDVNVSTASGTCRYSGSLLGSGGVSRANVGGDIYRLSAGCGGPDQLRLRTNLSYTDPDGGTL